MRTLLSVALLFAACTDSPSVPRDATLDSDVSDAVTSSDAHDASQEPPNAPVTDAGLDADR